MSRKELASPWLYEKPWYKPGKWDVTHFTWSKSVREWMPNLPKKVLPTDTTLREGVEMAGVHLDIEGYVEVAKRLEDLGVKEMDLGYAGNPEHLEALHRCSESGVNSSLRIITRFVYGKWKEEIDNAVKAGADVIKIQANAGKPWRIKVTRPDVYKLRKVNKMIPVVIENIQYIKEEYDLYTQVGITDSTHADIKYLQEISKASVDAGADRMSFSDSRGVGSPPAMQYLCQEIKKVVGDADIQVHCHNDFGLAVANTLASVQGGCTSFDCTINGLGDRAGNAAIEECVVSLEMLYGIDTGINLEKLYDLTRWMEEKTGVKMQRNKAVTGEGAFLEESETHIRARWLTETHGLTDDWFLSYSPTVVGQSHKAVWGSTSLRGDAIRSKLENMGLTFNNEDVEAIRKRVWKELNAKVGSGRIWITDIKFEELIKEILKN